jgi:parallel beta-helix repeat protein
MMFYRAGYVLLAVIVIPVLCWRQPVQSRSAGVYYVAPDGRTDGDGSKQNPFSSAEAALARVAGGSTVIFQPGVYRGPIYVPLRLRGTREQPTILRSEQKWKAVIVGAPYNAIQNEDGCDWVIVDGFEVMGARYGGIKMNGDFNTVRNCYVHNNQFGGIASYKKTGTTIENNVVEYNGVSPQFHHGIYVDGDRLTVQANVVRHNASHGLHLYSSLKNSVVVNNLVHGHTNHSGILIACPAGGGRNRIVNNTIASNAIGLHIMNGCGEVIANNIIADNKLPLLLDQRTQNLTQDHNLIHPKPAKPAPHTISGDPGFVDMARGVFWLRPGSAAISSGSPQRAPTVDFWGRPRSAEGRVDVGCFPFFPSLARPAARQQWYAAWAYRAGPGAKEDVPDFWIVPDDAGRENTNRGELRRGTRSRATER